jgi:hypothetical protein
MWLPGSSIRFGKRAAFFSICYQVAQNLGFNGDFRAWEHLLRIYE